MTKPQDLAQATKPHLSLWDSVSIIVGIVVGAGIYETAPLVFANSSSPEMAVLLWTLGGALSLVGALCYAELASAYPKSGGDYVYLSRAFGSWMGFLFGWAQLAVIFTGSIGMMAYIFADYAGHLWNLNQSETLMVAIAPVLILSSINVVILFGKRTQNFFTIVKILGLLLVVIAGFWAAGASSDFPTETQITAATSPADFNWGIFGLGMVFVLYTYGGWNDAAFVASELKDRKNIPRTLILGTLAIVLIYLMVNISYLQGLGFTAAQNSKAIAADLLQKPFGALGSNIISLLVMVSALGAVNGLIYTGSRLYSAMGADHQVFSWLNQWHPKYRSPVTSLMAQALVSICLMILVGSPWGRSLISSSVQSIGAQTPSWEGHGGFDTLLRCTAPIFWMFFFLTGISLFILRWKDPKTPRPFKVPLYPVTPAIFCATSAYMFYRSVTYAGSLALVGVTLLVIGFPLYFLRRATEAPLFYHQQLNNKTHGGFMKNKNVLSLFGALVTAIAIFGVSPAWAQSTTSASTITESPDLDVPFVPTPQPVVDKMLDMAQVKRGEKVMDLGCGDGRIVVTAAKKYGARAIGVDLDPERVKESQENVKDNKVGHLVEIRKGDALKTDVSTANVVTLYLLPSVNMKLRAQLQKLKPGTRIVSHDFDMGDWKPLQTAKVNANGREHTIYLWEIGKSNSQSVSVK